MNGGQQPGDGQNLLIGAGTAVLGVFGVLWSGGVLSALITGHRVPHGHPIGAFTAFTHLSDPSLAWQAPVGGPVIYWGVTILLFVILGVLAVLAWSAWNGITTRQKNDPTKIAGLASRREVSVAAGRKSLLSKGKTLRPGLVDPDPAQVGYQLGHSRGVGVWSSVEDSMILLGPPRSGKGLHTVIPMILDAPGAVITTSTRPDNLTVTLTARTKLGPVAVFDPQGLAAGVPSATRWSPIRGCETPQVAMIRARALCADPGEGVENGSFWAQQSYTAVRCLLHAAALDHRPPIELFRWSLSPIAAQDAADILQTHPQAAPAWATALSSIIDADPRQRDSTWAMVSNVFSALADPRVLDAVSPAEGEDFDPTAFLTERGTLYLLGTSSGASATAGLIGAFVEDVAEAARKLAAASPGARLDPPLAFILDEGANYPFPSLPALMSEGGGTGITTLVVLQSLAQARSKWGQQDAEAIWDSAITKIILGGSGNAGDLRDLSLLIGQREEKRRNESWGTDGRKSISITTHDTPILDPGQLRTLTFGHGVLLLRSAPPIMLTLQPWIDRDDVKDLHAERTVLEQTIRNAATTPTLLTKTITVPGDA
jgi:type IV secretory pathway TraG/TraD family ATPase VirD4